MDSTNWVLNSAKDSLGYILADQGFDVWLGNIRGNVYSQRHVKMNNDQEGYWDFSWQDMAEYDLPAMIDHALLVTGQSELFYVGHSQGTLIGFTGFSSNKKLAKKIKTFFALAPVYTVAHCSEVVKGAAYALYPVEHVFQNHVNEEFVPGRFMKRLSDAGFCGGATSEKLCYKAGETLFGFDSSNINMERVPVIIAHWGSGTSLKNMVHFGQMVTSGKCQKYSYGYWYNYEKYGQITPPEYRVEDMTTPAVLFSGSHDTLADPLDVDHLRAKITNLHHFEEIQGWNHADFLFGSDAPQKVYNKMLKMMKDMLYRRAK
ncbi:Gastric triacylglycerol lipase [Exaiptasia diaphana]|nr:Gastric triacylglycerol lipase [Exaiptasia diaphana]